MSTAYIIALTDGSSEASELHAVSTRHATVFFAPLVGISPANLSGMVVVVTTTLFLMEGSTDE